MIPNPDENCTYHVWVMETVNITHAVTPGGDAGGAPAHHLLPAHCLPRPPFGRVRQVLPQRILSKQIQKDRGDN